MNNEDRKTMVGLQMEKANRFMEQAEMVRDLQQWDMANLIQELKGISIQPADRLV